MHSRKSVFLGAFIKERKLKAVIRNGRRIVGCSGLNAINDVK